MEITRFGTSTSAKRPQKRGLVCRIFTCRSMCDDSIWWQDNQNMGLIRWFLPEDFWRSYCKCTTSFLPHSWNTVRFFWYNLFPGIFSSNLVSYCYPYNYTFQSDDGIIFLLFGASFVSQAQMVCWNCGQSSQMNVLQHLISMRIRWLSASLSFKLTYLLLQDIIVACVIIFCLRPYLHPMHPYPNELLLYKGKSLCPVAKLLVYMGMGMALLKQRMGVGQGYIYAKILKMKIKIKPMRKF